MKTARHLIHDCEQVGVWVYSWNDLTNCFGLWLFFEISDAN